MSLVYLTVANTFDINRPWRFLIVGKSLITKQKPQNTRESGYEFEFKKIGEMNVLLLKAAHLAVVI